MLLTINDFNHKDGSIGNSQSQVFTKVDHHVKSNFIIYTIRNLVELETLGLTMKCSIIS